MQRDHFR